MSLKDEKERIRQQSKEIRAAHENGIFASDVARIMTGQSVRVALEKLGEIVDQGEGLEDVEEIQLGHMLEPKILDAYQEKYNPQKLIRKPNTMMHPEEKWLGCHLDAVAVEEHGIIDVECKSVGWYNRKYWGEGGDEIPNKVLWQVIAQMAAARYEGHKIKMARVPVCFLNSAAFMAYIMERPLPITVFEVPADEDLEMALIVRCRKVWECIEAKVIPLPEDIGDVKLIYQKDSGEVIEATKEVVEQVILHLKIKETEKELGLQKERCEFNIKTFMREAAILRYGHRTIATWKNDADGLKFDEAAFARDNPDEYRIYMKTRPGPRKLLTKERAAKELIEELQKELLENNDS